MMTDRRDAAELQTFTCTVESERTSQGRRLPHPRPWEREAQSLLRVTGQRLRHGDVLVVGRTPTPPHTIITAAWLSFEDLDTPQVFITACGVANDFRGRGGAVANSLIDQVIHVSHEWRAALDASQLLVHGNVHVRNRPSADLLLRKMFEPIDSPRNEYQTWTRMLGSP